MWNSLLVSIYITPEYQPQEFAGEEFYFATIEEFEIAIDIKRKISYGTRSELGKRAWENMFSIMDTCRKQEVNFFNYLNGIFSSRNDLPKLANLIYNTP